MNVIYTTEKYKAEHPAIFLAGPSPRNDQTFTWRPQALEILEKLEFQGTVYNPEQRTPGCIDFSKSEYPAAWEHEAIWNSDVLVFWVPRHMEKLPAFTTNIEFGYFLAHPDAREKLKIIYGRPDSAPKNKYLDFLWNKTFPDKTILTGLEAVLTHAVLATDHVKRYQTHL